MKDERIHGIRIKCYATPETKGGFDRYTVAYPTETYDGHSRMVSMVGLTGHTGGYMGRHLGKRIRFKTLPAHLQQTVRGDCKDYANATRRAKNLHA